MQRVLGTAVVLVVFVALVILRPYFRTMDHVSRGDSLAAKGDFESAFFAYGNALHRDPDNPLPYFRRGVAMQIAGQHNKAQVDFNDVIRLRPNFGPAYRLRAETVRAMGLVEKAQEDEAKADSLNVEKDLAKLREINSVPSK